MWGESRYRRSQAHNGKSQLLIETWVKGGRCEKQKGLPLKRSTILFYCRYQMLDVTRANLLIFTLGTVPVDYKIRVPFVSRLVGAQF